MTGSAGGLEFSHVVGATERWEPRLCMDDLVVLEPQVQSFLGAHDVDSRAGYVATLVVEEILRNLIEHTPPDASEERASVQIDVEPGVVRVVIEDTRPPFDPADGPTLDVDAPIEARRIGGMGLHLVRQLTDSSSYAREGQRNRFVAEVGRR